jgi:hypothetical protein
VRDGQGGSWRRACGHQRQTHERLARLATTTALHAKAALAFGDRKAAAETLDLLRPDEEVLAAGVYDATGQLFAGYRRKSTSAGSGGVAPDLREISIASCREMCPIANVAQGSVAWATVRPLLSPWQVPEAVALLGDF